ncbi:formyltransferase family protein [Sphingomonas sp. GC_Shp_1]|uniref:formyltransferase family protein n=1 Tax=Sphingomonas sp. GC_Shp_1 TaxID=2937385 RepID=UPI00226B5A26|nr:formyltransferase family protein [Sphingomonas sp. GC_Shp_1]
MLRRRVPARTRLVAIPSTGDDGVDRWQPSFAKYLRGLDDVDVVDLEDTYAMAGLLFLSTEYDRLLRPARFRDDARLVNIHFSLLPAYKGMFTSSMPILDGAATTGVSLHRIDPGIDTGDIIDQQPFGIADADTAKSLYARYLDVGAALIDRNLDGIIAGEEEACPQDPNRSTYVSRSAIDYANLTVDLNQTALGIVRQVRAYNHRSYQLARIHDRPISRADIMPQRSVAKPGVIVACDATTLTIASIDHDCLCVVDRFDELIAATRRQDVATMAEILDRDPPLVEESGREGWTPLIVAAFNGLIDSAALLLARGADPNAGNQKLTVPLMYAKDHWVATGDDAMIFLLLRHGADPARCDIAGKTVLDYLPADIGARLTCLIDGHRAR